METVFKVKARKIYKVLRNGFWSNKFKSSKGLTHSLSRRGKGNKIMKYIKKQKKITLDYCNQLAEYIRANSKTFFDKENEADSWGDFVLWPDKKTDRNHLILKGEICLIDRMWRGVHSYVICEFYGDCRKVKDLFHVINIDNLPRADWKNGYFLLPELI